MKKKKLDVNTVIAITIIALCIVAALFIFIYRGKKSTNKEETTTQKTTEVLKANTNEDVIKDQTLDVFSFKNTSLIYEDGTSTLTTEVTNTSSSDASLQEFKIHVLNKDGSEIVTLTGFVGNVIKAGETKSIVSSYGDDLSEADKITYEIVK